MCDSQIAQNLTTELQMATHRGQSLGPSNYSPSQMRKMHYIYDLPYNPRRELCRLLETDDKWAELAGWMNIDSVDIRWLQKNSQHPAEEVLSKFGDKNGSIRRVFYYLAKMEHYRGMQILAPYVSREYHRLLDQAPRSGFSSDMIRDAQSSPSALPIYEEVPGRPSSNQIRNRPSTLSMNPNSPKNSPQASPVGDGRKTLSSVSPKTVKGHTSNSIVTNVKEPEYGLDRFKKVVSFDDFGDVLDGIEQIKYEELSQGTNNFSNACLLGRGAFGAVYKGQWSNIAVAVKKLHVAPENGNTVKRYEHIRQSIIEVAVLKKNRFDHIVALYGVSIDGPAPCLIYEYMANGTVDDHLRKKKDFGPLSWSQRASIASDVAKGLAFLHRKPLIHGDVKPANILLDAKMVAKLGDFGLTYDGPTGDLTHRTMNHPQGTRPYLPMEYLTAKQSSTKVDVHCYGSVLLELATGLRQIDTSNNPPRYTRLVDHIRHNLNWVAKLRDPEAGDVGASWFPFLIKLGLSCTHNRKEERPDMECVLQQINEEVSSTASKTGGTYFHDPTATVHQLFPPNIYPVPNGNHIPPPSHSPNFNQRLSPSLHPTASPPNYPRMMTPIPQVANTATTNVPLSVQAPSIANSHSVPAPGVSRLPINAFKDLCLDEIKTEGSDNDEQGEDKEE